MWDIFYFHSKHGTSSFKPLWNSPRVSWSCARLFPDTRTIANAVSGCHGNRDVRNGMGQQCRHYSLVNTSFACISLELLLLFFHNEDIFRNVLTILCEIETIIPRLRRSVADRLELYVTGLHQDTWMSGTDSVCVHPTWDCFGATLEFR